MCGIIGGVSKEPFHQSVIKTLFVMAMNRGKDSCGIANNETKEIIKEVGDSFSFIENDLSNHKDWIGHTRAKTTGMVSNRNAHPFRSGEIIGAHNGMISNWWKLKDEESIDIEVDSEIIFHLINKYGLEETLPRLKGSLAIAWFKDTKLHLYRHTNPCHIANFGDSWLFASEARYFKVLGVKDKDIMSIDEHELYTFENGELVGSEKIEAKPQSTYDYGYGYRYNNRSYTPANRQIGFTDPTSSFAPTHAKTIKDGTVKYAYWIAQHQLSTLHLTISNDSGFFQHKIFDIDLEAEQTRLEREYPLVYDELLTNNIFDVI